MANVVEINCTSGEVQERELTPEEEQARQLSLEEVKSQKVQELYMKCDEAISRGFVSTVIDVNNVPYEFYYAEKDQLKLNGQANLINIWLNRLSLGEITQAEFDTKFPIAWNTKSHGWVNFSYQEFVQILDDTSNHERNNYGKRTSLEAQVDIATTPEEVQLIVW